MTTRVLAAAVSSRPGRARRCAARAAAGTGASCTSSRRGDHAASLLATLCARLTYSHNATLGRRDFYRQLCLALGLAPAATATAGNFFYAVSTHVEELARERVHPVFLLDEAHLLHQDTLDHLHILLNYQWDSRALLSLVLVGLPELRDRLALRRNRSLYSRLHQRIARGEVIAGTYPCRSDTSRQHSTRELGGSKGGCGRPEPNGFWLPSTPGGTVTFKCHHNSCGSKSWDEFRRIEWLNMQVFCDGA